MNYSSQRYFGLIFGLFVCLMVPRSLAAAGVTQAGLPRAAAATAATAGMTQVGSIDLPPVPEHSDQIREPINPRVPIITRPVQVETGPAAVPVIYPQAQELLPCTKFFAQTQPAIHTLALAWTVINSMRPVNELLKVEWGTPRIVWTALSAVGAYSIYQKMSQKSAKERGQIVGFNVPTPKQLGALLVILSNKLEGVLTPHVQRMWRDGDLKKAGGIAGAFIALAWLKNRLPLVSSLPTNPYRIFWNGICPAVGACTAMTCWELYNKQRMAQEAEEK